MIEVRSIKVNYRDEEELVIVDGTPIRLRIRYQIEKSDISGNSHPAINVTDNVLCHQAAKYACCVNDEITEACVATRYEQLQEFNEAGENDEINREHIALLVETDAECKTSCRKNQQMLKIMGGNCLRPKTGRND